MKSNSKTNINASEAKGPFSRREEGWELGKKKKKKKKKKNLILVSMGHVTLRMGKKDT